MHSFGFASLGIFYTFCQAYSVVRIITSNIQFTIPSHHMSNNPPRPLADHDQKLEHSSPKIDNNDHHIVTDPEVMDGVDKDGVNADVVAGARPCARSGQVRPEKDTGTLSQQGALAKVEAGQLMLDKAMREAAVDAFREGLQAMTYVRGGMAVPDYLTRLRAAEKILSYTDGLPPRRIEILQAQVLAQKTGGHEPVAMTEEVVAAMEEAIREFKLSKLESQRIQKKGE